MKNLSKEARQSIYSDRLIARALKCLETRLHYGAEELTSSHAVKSYLQLHLAAEANEVFAALFLSNNKRVLVFEKLFTGSISQAMVYPRVVVQKALEYNAAAVIFAHNHPSGNSEPSTEDKELTRKLKSTLDIIDIELLDHFIVTGHECYSFAEHRLL